MNHKRFVAKALAATLLAGLTVGSLAGPAEARKDTGWNSTVVSIKDGPQKRDTGWNRT